MKTATLVVLAAILVALLVSPVGAKIGYVPGSGSSEQSDGDYSQIIVPHDVDSRPACPPKDDVATTTREAASGPIKAEAKIVNNYYPQRVVKVPVYRTRKVPVYRNRPTRPCGPVVCRTQRPIVVTAPAAQIIMVPVPSAPPAKSAPVVPAERKEPMSPLAQIIAILLVTAAVVIAVGIIYNCVMKVGLAQESRKGDRDVEREKTLQAVEATKQVRAGLGNTLIGKVDSVGMKEAPNAEMSISQMGDSLSITASKKAGSGSTGSGSNELPAAIFSLEGLKEAMRLNVNLTPTK